MDPILAGATTIDLTGGQNADLQLPYKATHGVAVAAAELGPRAEQNAPTFQSATLNCYEIYSDQRASMQTVDSVPDFEKMMVGWIVEDVYEQFAATPRHGRRHRDRGRRSVHGVELLPDQALRLAGALANVNFHTAFFALPAKFRPNAVWLMNSNTLATVSMMAHPASTAYEPLAKQDQAGVWTILGKRGRDLRECSGHRRGQLSRRARGPEERLRRGHASPADRARGRSDGSAVSPVLRSLPPWWEPVESGRGCVNKSNNS